ncbi:hypothetical protein Tco_1316982 [Tanacetum coccineum]
MALGYQNPFYLKQAQQKQQSLYNGKVLLEKHDPPAMYDSEETLELAQEKDFHKSIKDEILPIVNQVDARVQNFEIQVLKEAAKFVRDFKPLTKEADESLTKHKALELEIERLLRAVVSQDIMFIVQVILFVQIAIRNEKSEVICATCKQCLITANHDECKLQYVNGMKPRKKNQSVNVSKSTNQKKHKANFKKSKTLSSKDRLASSRPSKPRTYLKWLPTGRIFDLCRKITSSSNTESESDISVYDNASASNP